MAIEPFLFKPSRSSSKLKCKIELRGRSLYVDNIMIGMYGVVPYKLSLDSSLVIERVVKEIDYQVEWKEEEVVRLLEQEFHEKEWQVFKFRRGLLGI